MRLPALLLCLLLPLPLAAAEEPEAVYAKFHRAIVAGDLDDMLNYATAAQRAELARMSPAQKNAQVKMMAALMPRAYVLKDKAVNPGGHGARLLVSGAGPVLLGGKPETLYGTIRMMVEGGNWKVGEVNWSNIAPAGAAQAPAPKPAAAAQPAAAAKAAPKAAPVPPKGSPPVIGSMDSAPEKKLGTAKEPCVYKPVMTADDMVNCR